MVQVHEYRDEHIHLNAHARINAFSQNGDMNTDRQGVLYSCWLVWMDCTSLKHSQVHEILPNNTCTHRQTRSTCS